MCREYSHLRSQSLLKNPHPCEKTRIVVVGATRTFETTDLVLGLRILEQLRVTGFFSDSLRSPRHDALDPGKDDPF